jgi:uncharacterized RDD family membrane protein YckC
MESRPPDGDEPEHPEPPAGLPPVPPELATEPPDAPKPWERVAAQEPVPEGEPDESTPVVSWVAPGLPRKRLVPGARGLIYAGVIPRTIAWFLDSFLIGLTSVVVLGVLIAVIVGSPQQGDAALSVVAWIGIAVIATVYFIGFWTGPRRATPGMRLLKLQIGFVATGEPLSVRQAVLRVAALGIPFWPLIAIPQIGVISGTVLLVWPVILLVSTAVNARRRGLHDRAAWSAVVTPAGVPRTA